MYCLEEMLFIEGLLKDTDSARMDWKDIENHPLIDKKENELTVFDNTLISFLGDTDKKVILSIFVFFGLALFFII